MSTIWDKQRGKWKTRFTYKFPDGTTMRVYVGRYPTKTIGEVAEQLKRKELFEKYEMDYEETDKNVIRLIINRIRKARRAKAK